MASLTLQVAHYRGLARQKAEEVLEPLKSSQQRILQRSRREAAASPSLGTDGLLRVRFRGLTSTRVFVLGVFCWLSSHVVVQCYTNLECVLTSETAAFSLETVKRKITELRNCRR